MAGSTLKRTIEAGSQEAALVLGGAEDTGVDVEYGAFEVDCNVPEATGVPGTWVSFANVKLEKSKGSAELPGKPGKDEVKLPRLVTPGTVPLQLVLPGTAAATLTLFSKLSSPDENSLNASTSIRN